jgi:hypothetical protein
MLLARLSTNVSDMLPRSWELRTISPPLKADHLDSDFLNLGQRKPTSTPALCIRFYDRKEQTIGAPTIRSYGEQGLTLRWDWKQDAAAKLTRGSPAIAKLASAKAKNSKLKTIVFGWRQQLRQARVKNFEASELFSEGLRRIEAMTNQPNALRQFSVQQLREATTVYEVLSPLT